MKTVIAVLIAIVLPCGCLLLALNAWLTRRAARRDVAILAASIVPPVERFGLLSPADADCTRVEASRRRAASEFQQKRAAQIASGVPVDERIRLAGGQRWKS